LPPEMYTIKYREKNKTKNNNQLLSLWNVFFFFNYVIKHFRTQLQWSCLLQLFTHFRSNLTCHCKDQTKRSTLWLLKKGQLEFCSRMNETAMAD